MPWDALPEHINTSEKWSGTDWDNPFQRWLLKIKGIFAYSAVGRSRYWWANWREFPVVIIKWGEGLYRYEDDMSSWYEDEPEGFIANTLFNDSQYYLSRIQYLMNWHIALQWPLFLHGHYKDWQFYV